VEIINALNRKASGLFNKWIYLSNNAASRHLVLTNEQLYGLLVSCTRGYMKTFTFRG